jgi:hypothetical protein
MEARLPSKSNDGQKEHPTFVFMSAPRFYFEKGRPQRRLDAAPSIEKTLGVVKADEEAALETKQ